MLLSARNDLNRLEGEQEEVQQTMNTLVETLGDLRGLQGNRTPDEGLLAEIESNEDYLLDLESKVKDCTARTNGKTREVEELEERIVLACQRLCDGQKPRADPTLRCFDNDPRFQELFDQCQETHNLAKGTEGELQTIREHFHAHCRRVLGGRLRNGIDDILISPEERNELVGGVQRAVDLANERLRLGETPVRHGIQIQQAEMLAILADAAFVNAGLLRGSPQSEEVPGADQPESPQNDGSHRDVERKERGSESESDSESEDEDEEPRPKDTTKLSKPERGHHDEPRRIDMHRRASAGSELSEDRNLATKPRHQLRREYRRAQAEFYVAKKDFDYQEWRNLTPDE